MSLWIPKRNKDGGWSYVQVPLFPVLLILNIVAIVIVVIYVVVRDLITSS